MKKVFQTKRLNDLKRQERRSWLLFPAIMLLLFVFFGASFLRNDSGGRYAQGLFRFFVWSALIAVCFGAIPFYFIRARIRGAAKEALQNCSFITVQNLDYYREKLCGLTPGGISLLADLKLEPEKDVSASVLRYEQLGLIRGDESGGYAETKNAAATGLGNFGHAPQLKKSDEFLLRSVVLGNAGGEQKTWQNMVISEVKEDGLITEKAFANLTTGQPGQSAARFFTVWLVGFLILGLIYLPGMLRDKSESRGETLSLPEWVFFYDDLKEDLEKTSEEARWNHGASFYEENEYLFSQPYYFWELALCTLVTLYALLLIFAPLLYLKMRRSAKKEQSPYRRTEKGNELAEYVWGMKNFIHDFSNLGEADKDALVLWNDYLVYAVVLEENEKIVEEMKTRRKHLCGL